MLEGDETTYEEKKIHTSFPAFPLHYKTVKFHTGKSVELKHQFPSAFSSNSQFVITARVRSTTGRYCFHRCLSVHRGGGGVRVPPPGGDLTGYPPGGLGTPPGGVPDRVPPPHPPPPRGGVPDWVPPQGGYLTRYHPPRGGVPDRVPLGGYQTGYPPGGGYLTGYPPGGVPS